MMLERYLILLGTVTALAGCGNGEPPLEATQMRTSELAQAEDAHLFYRPGNWSEVRDAYNPAGTTRVVRLTQGVYYVILNGMGSAKGNAQISTVAGLGQRCNLINALQNPSGEEALMLFCRDQDGNRRNLAFTAYYTQAPAGVSNEPLNRGFVTSESKTSPVHVPVNAYSSTGGEVEVSRLSTGRYVTTFLNANTTGGGNVQITALGADAFHCKVRQMAAAGSSFSIFVDCYDASNALIDSRFSLLYTKGTSLHAGLGAYATIVGPDGGAQIPPFQAATVAWQYDGGPASCGPNDPVEAYAPPSYVRFPKQLDRTGPPVALATAYGSGAGYCNLGSSNTDFRVVRVACYASGPPDSFMLAVDRGGTTCQSTPWEMWPPNSSPGPVEPSPAP